MTVGTRRDLGWFGKLTDDSVNKKLIAELLKVEIGLQVGVAVIVNQAFSNLAAR